MLLLATALCLTTCGAFDVEDSDASSNNPVAIVKIAQALAKLTACINTHFVSFQATDTTKLESYRKFNDEHAISELINACADRKSFCTLERLDSATKDCEELL